MLYRVLTRINHDGKNIEPGEEAEFFGENAATLLTMGAIQSVHIPFSKKNHLDEDFPPKRFHTRRT